MAYPRQGGLCGPGRGGQSRAQAAQTQTQGFTVAVAELGGFIEGQTPAHVAQGAFGYGEAVLTALEALAFVQAIKVGGFIGCFKGDARF